MTASIVLTDVSFTYAGAASPSLSNLTIEIAAGEYVVLTGRSGCGKSTVVQAICGLIPHTSGGTLTGSVQLGDVSVATAHSAELARRVGVVFQDPRSQFFTTTVDDEIAFACENLGVPGPEIEQRVQEAAELAGVTELRGRAIFGLSSGQKQLVALASVLAARPAVLLLDEPSANLDPESTARLGAVLARLHRRGHTIVVAEHRLGYLLGAADRLVRLDRGRITHEWSAATARTLSAAVLRELGLRSPLPAEAPTATPVPPLLPPSEPSARTASAVVSPQARSIAFTDLTVRAGRVPVQRALTKTVTQPPGGLIALTGPIGSGKTTLARAIAGLTRITSGKITVDGTARSTRQLVRDAFFVMQDTDYQLFSDSVFHELAIAAPGLEPRRAAAILSDLGLDGLGEAHPLRLSGGQKQRLAIAAAVASGTRILVFDEPTSGLDADSMRRVAGILRRLSESGALVIVTTHDEEFLGELPAARLVLQRIAGS